MPNICVCRLFSSDFWSPKANRTGQTKDIDQLKLEANLEETETFQASLFVKKSTDEINRSKISGCKTYSFESQAPAGMMDYSEESIYAASQTFDIHFDIESNRSVEIHDSFLSQPFPNDFKGTRAPFQDIMQRHIPHSEIGLIDASRDGEDNSRISQDMQSTIDSIGEMQWSSPDSISIIRETKTSSHQPNNENDEHLVNEMEKRVTKSNDTEKSSVADGAEEISRVAEPPKPAKRNKALINQREDQFFHWLPDKKCYAFNKERDLRTESDKEESPKIKGLLLGTESDYSVPFDKIVHKTECLDYRDHNLSSVIKEEDALPTLFEFDETTDSVQIINIKKNKDLANDQEIISPHETPKLSSNVPSAIMEIRGGGIKITNWHERNNTQSELLFPNRMVSAYGSSVSPGGFLLPICTNLNVHRFVREAQLLEEHEVVGQRGRNVTSFNRKQSHSFDEALNHVSQQKMHNLLAQMRSSSEPSLAILLKGGSGTKKTKAVSPIAFDEKKIIRDNILSEFHSLKISPTVRVKSPGNLIPSSMTSQEEKISYCKEKYGRTIEPSTGGIIYNKPTNVSLSKSDIDTVKENNTPFYNKVNFHDTKENSKIGGKTVTAKQVCFIAAPRRSNEQEMVSTNVATVPMRNEVSEKANPNIEEKNTIIIATAPSMEMSQQHPGPNGKTSGDDPTTPISLDSDRPHKKAERTTFYSLSVEGETGCLSNYSAKHLTGITKMSKNQLLMSEQGLCESSEIVQPSSSLDSTGQSLVVAHDSSSLDTWRILEHKRAQDIPTSEEICSSIYTGNSTIKVTVPVNSCIMNDHPHNKYSEGSIAVAQINEELLSNRRNSPFSRDISRSSISSSGNISVDNLLIHRKYPSNEDSDNENLSRTISSSTTISPSPFNISDCDPEITSATMSRPRNLLFPSRLVLSNELSDVTQRIHRITSWNKKGYGTTSFGNNPINERQNNLLTHHYCATEENNCKSESRFSSISVEDETDNNVPHETERAVGTHNSKSVGKHIHHILAYLSLSSKQDLKINVT